MKSPERCEQRKGQRRVVECECRVFATEQKYEKKKRKKKVNVLPVRGMSKCRRTKNKGSSTAQTSL